MAESRVGADILNIRPDFHKVALEVAANEQLGAYTLVGVRSADGLAEQVGASPALGAYNRVYVAHEEFDASGVDGDVAKYETVDNVILKLKQDGSIAQDDVGKLAMLVDHETVALDDGATADLVGEIVKVVSSGYVRVHVKRVV